MKEQNEILDEAITVEYSKALFRTRMFTLIFFCLELILAFPIANFLNVSSNYLLVFTLPKIIIIPLVVAIFLISRRFYVRKYYIYLNEFDNQLLTLHILNPFGKKNVENIRLPTIRKVVLRKIFFTKFYSVEITISTQTKRYILIGDIPLHELVPWLKSWKSKFN